MTIKDIEALVRPNIRGLCPYSTARDEFGGKAEVFLDANESPYPTGWNRYPDPRQKELKSALAAIKGIRTENLFLGNGSDEAIDLIFRIFCEPGRDNVISICPSYGMYGVSADINDVTMHEVLLEEDFSLDTEKILSRCDSRTKAIFLCSPNNPSGNLIPGDQIRDILEKTGAVVVVDEAYIDFSSEPSLSPLTEEFPNLIVLQTCSKARGLAALRLGMAISNEYIITLMSMVKYPYNINESTQKLALEALRKPISAEVREIISQRELLASRLAEFECVEKVYPSEANFLLIKVDDADAMYNFLIGNGVIVRNRTHMPLCRNCLRATVGLKEENEKLIEVISAYEKSNICR